MQEESFFEELRMPQEFLEPTLSSGERLIRFLVLAGFFVVLTLEVWLLWKAWQLWA
jgi:hypothetical protein